MFIYLWVFFINGSLTFRCREHIWDFSKNDEEMMNLVDFMIDKKTSSSIWGQEKMLKWFFNEKLMAKNALGCSVEQQKGNRVLFIFIFPATRKQERRRKKLISRTGFVIWWTFLNRHRRQWLRRWNWMLTNDKTQNWRFHIFEKENLSDPSVNPQIRLRTKLPSPPPASLLQQTGLTTCTEKCFSIKIPFYDFSFGFFRFLWKKGSSGGRAKTSLVGRFSIHIHALKGLLFCFFPVFFLGVQSNISTLNLFRSTASWHSVKFEKWCNKKRSHFAYFIASFRNEND